MGKKVSTDSDKGLVPSGTQANVTKLHDSMWHI